jgi:hypothetical protein
MKGRSGTILLASVASIALLLGTSRGFAVEPGDFGSSFRGATMGVPLGAAPPPGLYFDLLTFAGPNGVGQGQDKGTTVDGFAVAPALVWSTGWNFLGGTPVFSVVQPIYDVAGVPSSPGNPLAFGDASNWENVHNTIWGGAVSWNVGQGWHVSAGFNFEAPDGSTYIGTLNPDYWTFTPNLNFAYLTKDWKITVNFAYDIYTASTGHTGLLPALASLGGLPPSAAAFAESAANGYSSGDEGFIDWAAAYKVGKWSFGPAGYFRFQTTADSPGNGITCAQLTAHGLPSCGTDTDIALGGMLGYNLGPANFEVYVVDSVYTQDDFKGPSVFTRLSFKLWPDEPAPVSKPLYTKGN